MTASATQTASLPTSASKPTLTKILYDRKSAAFALSISTRSLDYLIANKRLNTVKLGTKSMVSHGELIKFSRQHHASISADSAQ